MNFLEAIEEMKKGRKVKAGVNTYHMTGDCIWDQNGDPFGLFIGSAFLRSWEVVEDEKSGKLD